MIIVLDILPQKITAGLTLDQRVTLTEAPAPEWSMSAHLRGPMAINITGGNDGNAHTIKASAETTAAWTPGKYWYSVRVTDGADVVEIDNGQIEIEPDLVSVSGEYDGRTHAERTLEAIEAVIEKRATKDQRRYKVNNRELERMGVGELLRFRDYYKEQIRRERAASRGQSLFGRKILARF